MTTQPSVEYDLEMKSYAREPTAEKLERLLDKKNKFSRRLLDFLIKFYVEKTTINETAIRKAKERRKQANARYSKKNKRIARERQQKGEN